MKTKHILMASALAATALMTTSCGSDFLDKTPSGNYTAPTLYSSDAAVRTRQLPVHFLHALAFSHGEIPVQDLR